MSSMWVIIHMRVTPLTQRLFEIAEKQLGGYLRSLDSMLLLRCPVRHRQGLCCSRFQGTQKNWWNPSDLQSPHLVIHNLKTGLPYQIVAICGTTHHSGNDSDQLPPFTISIQQALTSEFKRRTDSNKGFLRCYDTWISVLLNKLRKEKDMGSRDIGKMPVHWGL